MQPYVGSKGSAFNHFYKHRRTMFVKMKGMQGATLCGGAGGKTARVQGEAPGRVQGGNPAQ